MPIELRQISESELRSKKGNDSDIGYSLDFIKGINRQYLFSEQLEQLNRAEKAGNSLTVEISGDKDSLIIIAEMLAWDSNHFGSKIGKIVDIYSPAEKISSSFWDQALETYLNFIDEKKIDYLFSSLDLRRNFEIQQLSKNGFVPIEHRVAYYQSLKDFSYPKRFKTRLAAEEDLPSLIETAESVENKYDRFYGDPYFERQKVQQLMGLWVSKSVMGEIADGTIVPDLPKPKAFCTFKTHESKWEGWGVKLSQPILAAVSPECSGWYVRIMSELTYHLREAGADYSFLTTQLANHAVIRTWQALGYKYGSSEVVLRRVKTS